MFGPDDTTRTASPITGFVAMREHDAEEAEADREQLLPGPPKSDRRMKAWFRARRRALRRGVRRPLRLASFAAKFVVLPLVALFAAVVVFAPSYSSPPAHYRLLERRCRESGFAPGCANPNNETLFISSILYDKGGRLSGGLWGRRLLELVDLLGADNVFLSIYESGSGPEGRAALARFRERVPCRHEIVSDEAFTLAGIPNVTMPDGTSRTKRIAFLAELRNRALRPLDRLGDGLVRFDKVMFINDVSFRPLDAANLVLSTNRGADGRSRYLGACALDFAHPFAMYDNYAFRDAEGYAQYVNLYPFFARRGRALSRSDIFAQTDAVRVKACWGGMMVVQARYVQNVAEDLPSADFRTLEAHTIWPDRPRNVTAPVRFRYEPEPYYDACESCLFPADVAAVARREGAAETGLYVNPYVRTAYSEAILNWLPKAQRMERLILPLFTFFTWFTPDDHQPYRQTQEGEPVQEEIWDGSRWKMVDRVARSAMFCGVREMQTLRRIKRSHGRNWWDTRHPPGRKQPFSSMWGQILPEDWRERYAAASEEDRFNFFEFDRWGQA